MVSITIRDVPESLRAVLAERARCRGTSLQEYLLMDLADEASLPTMDEWLDEVEEDLVRTMTAQSAAEILAARDEARRG